MRTATTLHSRVGTGLSWSREDLGPFSRGSADFWRGGEKFFLPTFCYAFKRYKL